MDNLQLGNEIDLPIPPEIGVSSTDSLSFECNPEAVDICLHIPSGVTFHCLSGFAWHPLHSTARWSVPLGGNLHIVHHSEVDKTQTEKHVCSHLQPKRESLFC
ncbi:hypothetical protein CEXT_487981 [Caerostris extrusa]|uniref:Uncharacterized protein n=1 Tax=Caerostris extrusa TaxID=172846 RepID=A0AAV4Y2R0_CAEEX|nr:hypothetical protein CEXT_487981 [Caerostris extrusa]